MSDVTAQLAERLTTGAGRLAAVAALNGVDLRQARRAAKEAPIAATDFLKLCAACGFDPVTRGSIPPRPLGGFDHAILAMGVKMAMLMRGQSVRQAAEAMGVSSAAIVRLRQAHPVSIGTLLKACGYLGRHPFDDCAPLSFTENSLCNRLKEKQNERVVG